MGNALGKFKLNRSLNGEVMACFYSFAAWQFISRMGGDEKKKGVGALYNKFPLVKANDEM
jgi:hypothetical protein